MNRRGGGEEIMFFAFFFIISIIALGIVLGVSIFFVKEYDFRMAEAQSLALHVYDCFQDEDFFVDGFEEDFFSKCKINENVFGKHLVYVKSLSDDNKIFLIGVNDYRNQCFFNNVEDNLDLPRCVNETIMKQGEKFHFIVGANQKSARLKL